MISSDDARRRALEHIDPKSNGGDPPDRRRTTVLDGWPESSYRTSTEAVWTVWVSGPLTEAGGSRCIVISQRSGEVLMDARVGG